jgi:heme exporter protein CcmD
MDAEGSGSFFEMGGDATFIWRAYRIAALMLIVVAVLSWRRLRAAERALRRLPESNPEMSDDS